MEASRAERTQALTLLQRSGAASIQGSSEWQATEMLRAGHTPTEPHIARVLNSLRGRSLGKLFEGRLLCPGSLYVVGQPGVCHFIKEANGRCCWFRIRGIIPHQQRQILSAS